MATNKTPTRGISRPNRREWIETFIQRRKHFLFQVSPEIASNDVLLKEHIAKLIRLNAKEIQHVSILKRSIDARQKAVKFNLKVAIYLVGETFEENKKNC